MPRLLPGVGRPVRTAAVVALRRSRRHREHHEGGSWRTSCNGTASASSAPTAPTATRRCRRRCCTSSTNIDGTIAGPSYGVLGQQPHRCRPLSVLVERAITDLTHSLMRYRTAARVRDRRAVGRHERRRSPSVLLVPRPGLVPRGERQPSRPLEVPPNAESGVRRMPRAASNCRSVVGPSWVPLTRARGTRFAAQIAGRRSLPRCRARLLSRNGRFALPGLPVSARDFVRRLRRDC